MKRHLDLIFVAFVENSALVSFDAGTSRHVDVHVLHRSPFGHFQSQYGSRSDGRNRLNSAAAPPGGCWGSVFGTPAGSGQAAGLRAAAGGHAETNHPPQSPRWSPRLHRLVFPKGKVSFRQKRHGKKLRPLTETCRSAGGLFWDSKEREAPADPKSSPTFSPWSPLGTEEALFHLWIAPFGSVPAGGTADPGGSLLFAGAAAGGFSPNVSTALVPMRARRLHGQRAGSGGVAPLCCRGLPITSAGAGGQGGGRVM